MLWSNVAKRVFILWWILSLPWILSLCRWKLWLTSKQVSLQFDPQTSSTSCPIPPRNHLFLFWCACVHVYLGAYVYGGQRTTRGIIPSSISHLLCVCVRARACARTHAYVRMSVHLCGNVYLPMQRPEIDDGVFFNHLPHYF